MPRIKKRNKLKINSQLITLPLTQRRSESNPKASKLELKASIMGSTKIWMSIYLWVSKTSKVVNEMIAEFM